MATLLTAPSEPADPIDAFTARWGIDRTLQSRGGLLRGEAADAGIRPSPRQVVLLQRKTSKPGDGLGRTTGWIHRIELKERGVRMLAGVQYEGLEADGLRITVDGMPTLIPVDTIVVCAGQESVRPALGLAPAQPVHWIGGAVGAAEVDAERALRAGAELAARL